jgi:hypothetical protein
MTTRTLRLPALALAAALAAACTPNGGSIYFTLENEVKVDDFSLPNAVTVFDVVRLGTNFYAAAGTIWRADVGADSFQVDDVLAPPGGAGATQLCTALAAFGGNLYGGFVAPSGNLGLYKAAVADFATLPLAVADALVAGAQVALLKVQNDGVDKLVVVTAREASGGFEYSLATSDDGTNYTALPFDGTRPAGDEQQPIRDVIRSTVAAPDAWFVTEGTKLYTDGGTGTLTLASMTGITAGEELTGLYDDGANIYVASRAGAIYRSTTGASWTRIEVPTVSGAHPPLTRFGGVLGGTHLLVGSDGYGYYRLETATDTLTRYATTTSTLYTASVRSLVVDGSTVFALTGGRGLWRGEVSGNDVTDWQQE